MELPASAGMVQTELAATLVGGRLPSAGKIEIV